MSELKNKINFTVACVDEFAQKNNLSVKEAFQYLFQFKGIEFIKENKLSFSECVKLINKKHKIGLVNAYSVVNCLRKM